MAPKNAWMLASNRETVMKGNRSFVKECAHRLSPTVVTSKGHESAKWTNTFPAAGTTIGL